MLIVYSINYAQDNLKHQTPKTLESSDTTNRDKINEDDEIILSDDETNEEEMPPIEKWPELLTFIKADYPPHIYKKGIEGSVLLELIINEDGTVDSVSVAKSLMPTLDSSAMIAALKFKFSPALADGKPVPVLLQYEYRFSLQEIVKKLDTYINFSGKLVEKGTRTPISDAMVVLSFIGTVSDTSLPVPFPVYLKRLGTLKGQYIEENKLVTTTDSLGHFQFSSLPLCSLLISCPIPGYENLEEREYITPSQELIVTYNIKRISYSDYEIVVYGKTEKKEVSRRQLSLNEVKMIPGFGGDAVKVVQALPGVARPSFTSGELIIRGSSDGDSRCFIDGIEIPLIFHFGGLKSTYNSDLLSSVNLYPGGFNSYFGGTIGGAIEIIGRKAKTDRWHGSVDANGLDASFLFEGPISDKISISATARRSYVDKIIEKVTKNLSVTVLPAYWDIIGRLDYKINSKHSMYLTYFSARDNVKIVGKNFRGGSSEISDPNTFGTDETFHSLLYGYNSKFSDKITNKLRIGFCNDKSQGSGFGQFKFKVDQYKIHLRNQLTYTPNNFFKINTGIDAFFDSTYYKLKIMSSDEGIVNNWDKKLYTDIGLYSNIEFKPFEKLLVIPGIRYDYYKELDEGTVLYRFNTRYKVNPKFTLKAAVGSYSQTPLPKYQITDTSWGNPDIPPTLAYHYTGGFEWQITDLLFIDIQGYYNRQKDIPRYTSERNEATGKPINFAADMEGRMYGLELMLRHDQGKRFFGWISYSLSRSERRAPGPIEQTYAKTTDWDPNKWYVHGKDQTNHIQLVGNLRLPKNWATGFRFRYVTGNPVTPHLSYTEGKYKYDSDNGRYVSIEGKPYSDRMGPFIQLDLRVDKKYILKRWILTTYLDIFNVNYFFYNSPEIYAYNYDESDRKPVGFIFLPSIGIKAEF